MDHENYSDPYLREVLTGARTIAIVGASPRRGRPSHGVMAYLQRHGYRTIPVNPNAAGDIIHGEKCYASLTDVPEPIDMVDIFRAARYAPAIVEEALALSPRPQVIWMQLGIRNDEAAVLAEQSGLKVVMNRCPKIEYGRLSSEIAWMGVNTRTLTAKKARLFGRGIQRMALNRVTLTGGATDAAVRAEKPGR